MKRGKCVHYNGTVNERCNAGVNYKELAGDPHHTGYGLRLPCHSADYKSFSGKPLPRADAVSYCDKRREPTDAEIAEHEAESKRMFEDTMVARKAIVEHLGGPWKEGVKGAAGSIECPVCKTGSLRFSRAGINGHIHAQCKTVGCVAWME